MITGWDKPRKPSPVIFLSGLGDAMKESIGFLFLLLISFFFNISKPASEGSSPARFWGFLGIVAVILLTKAHKIFAWFFTRFWVEGNKVILTSGIFVKSRVELPLEKIQTIQVDQNVLHRLTNTCKFTMDTAGTGKPEFVIEAMDMKDALDFQQWVYSRQGKTAEEKEEVTKPSFTPLLSLSGKDFAKLCLSENHLRSLFIILAFVFSKFYDISEQLGFDSKSYVASQTSGLVFSIKAVSTLLILALLVSIIFSSIRVLIRFYDYQVIRRSESFEISWGLLTRQRKIMPFSKMEFISWSANWLRGKIQLFEFRIHSLAESETNKDLQVHMPVTSVPMLEKLLQQYIPERPSESAIPPVGLHPSYWYRPMFLLLFLFIPATAWLAYLQGWWALCVAAFYCYLFVSRYLAFRHFKIWLSGTAIQIEKGV